MFRTIYLVTGLNPEANTCTPFPIQSLYKRRAHFWGEDFSSPISRVAFLSSLVWLNSSIALHKSIEIQSRLNCHSLLPRMYFPISLTREVNSPPKSGHFLCSFNLVSSPAVNKHCSQPDTITTWEYICRKRPVANFFFF